MGCGIGYGYLHRIPVRQVSQNKDIPAPPVIKPAVINNVMVNQLKNFLLILVQLIKKIIFLLYTEFLLLK